MLNFKKPQALKKPEITYTTEPDSEYEGVDVVVRTITTVGEVDQNTAMDIFDPVAVVVYDYSHKVIPKKKRRKWEQGGRAFKPSNLKKPSELESYILQMIGEMVKGQESMIQSLINQLPKAAPRLRVILNQKLRSL